MKQSTQEPSSIGEQKIGDEELKKHAPDLLNENTRQDLASSLQIVGQYKPRLDKIMQPIADKTGTKMSSRIKHPRVIVRKVIQKRMQKRDYHLKDVNDTMGFRFVYTQKKQEQAVKSEIEKAAKNKQFVILKQQEVRSDNYRAYHFDIAFPLQGGKTIRAEVQVMSQKEEAIATASHDAHAVDGDKPPKPIQKQLNKNEDKINKMSNPKAEQVSDTLIKAHKISQDSPLPKIFTNAVVNKASK